jgi:hypothetical protein
MTSELQDRTATQKRNKPQVARVRAVLATSARLRKACAGFCVLAAVMLFCIMAYAQSANDNMPAGELLRRAVDGELKAQDADHTEWMYQTRVRDDGKDQVKTVIETREGDLERLRSVNGQSLTPEQEKREDQRIDNLIHNRREQRKLRREKAEDGQKMGRLFKMLPDAMTARYGRHQGDLVEILFKPNPNFHPPSHEAAVFHGMEGRIWINTRENRLAEIEGHLMETIKFGGGLLGHLDKGGEFHVKQSEVGPGHWEITLLHVNMHGKVLFFKTIGVQQDETQTNFQQVPDNLTLAQAEEDLRGKHAPGEASK